LYVIRDSESQIKKRRNADQEICTAYMKLDFKQISLDEYINDIAESRRQIKNGKKISLKDL